ncbi:hypothetical protein WR164_15010 [Philodulcilactobacillus myokoensis]|uniref:Uncharacterized protein n=1 Tax=Philodulcilactobacillus myokoensis TaxID=2929573 RepID=A0A9W6B231_9LACO|nr:hypothetical protein [Philodulcilactobacillus myokoensis]GLB47522.1 hypothetical protein WR164_15010 [Philodulcilactobacillus myokoensis]
MEILINYIEMGIWFCILMAFDNAFAIIMDRSIGYHVINPNGFWNVSLNLICALIMII